MNNNETDRSEAGVATVQNAREMTAEIDRVTEEEVHKLELQNAEMTNRDQASALGGRILTSAPNIPSAQNVAPNPQGLPSASNVFPTATQGLPSAANAPFTANTVGSGNMEQLNTVQRENEVIQSNNLVRSEAEKAEGYTQVTERDLSLVGAETNVQAQEWLAEDREDIENESGLNGHYVKNIMDKNNKHITSETVAAVERMIAQNEYHPSKLDRMANQARTEFLKNVFNRILGSRN